MYIMYILSCIRSAINHCTFTSYKLYYQTFLSNPLPTAVILTLILLSNDVHQNPGPDNEGNLSIFHLNARSMRHKTDYIESIKRTI